VANPLGAISSLALMLRYSFKLEEEARAVELACQSALEEGYLTADLVGRDKAKSTNEVGDFIAKAVGSLKS
jgi:3-isopropylmalate dehydrogenase